MGNYREKSTEKDWDGVASIYDLDKKGWNQDIQEHAKLLYCTTDCTTRFHLREQRALTWYNQHVQSQTPELNKVEYFLVVLN